MDYIDFFLPFLTYGLPTLIIGIVIGTAYFFIDKFAPKISHKLYWVCFILGIALYTVYEAIFKGESFCLSKDIFSMGLICGSLGLGVFTFIKNLKSGKEIKGPVFAIIKEILSASVKTGVAENIATEIARKTSALNGENLRSEILNVLKLFPDEITDSDAEMLARLLYHGILPYVKGNPDA